MKYKLKIFFFNFKIFRKIIYFLFNFPKKYADFNCLNESSVFIDIGANIGRVSEYIFDTYNCKIDCYEPNPACYKFLKRKFNNEKINVYNYAVSNLNEKNKLYFHKNAKNNNDLVFSEAGSLLASKQNVNIKNYQIVKTVNIDEILYRYKKIDLIKIDIEGWEYKILDQIINQRKKIGKVICELHGNPEKRNINNNQKNKNLLKNYNSMKDRLIRENLYGSWFIEWI